MITLENDLLSVSINKKGAELSSFFHKEKKIEHIWQADSAIWPWHAPNLFPIVGGLVDNNLIIDNQKYAMQRHGFARHSQFSVIETSSKHAVFALRYNDETSIIYPYKFEFQLLYHLQDAELKCTYKVINLDTKVIWFSLGAHPAFNVPFSDEEQYEDYHLTFPQDQQLTAHSLSQGGYFNGQTKNITTDDFQLALNHKLFANDALVFKEIKSKEVILGNKKNRHKIKVSFSDFKQLGLWSKIGAPFLCIEPWLGYADTENSTAEIQEKEGMLSLQPGHVFEATYSIGVENDL